MDESKNGKIQHLFSDKNNKVIVLTIFALTIITTLAYSPILFNWFVGDDFVHLIWLKKAMVNPELILRNFYHNWLDVQTTSFYRPLISVFMSLDYSIWKVNGLGFHITNLFFHIVATISIFLFASGIFQDAFPKDKNEKNRFLESTIYAFCAAAIFGLYPLHSEAVAWITGRVDVIVTAFICLSLLAYRHYRINHKDLKFMGLALLSMTLALTSKEMAITLPFIFFAYSFFLEDKPEKNNLLKNLILCTKAVIPFFVLLAIYFLVRYFSLGTILGGYDNSFMPTVSIRHYVETWIHGLRMFLIPLNREIIPSSNPITYLWIITLLSTLGLYVFNLFTQPVSRKLSGFLLVFLVFAFLPVYKLFAIANDLQGSRLGHVASVAFALLVSISFIYNKKDDPKAKRVFAGLVAASYTILCFSGLWINNTNWRSAGQEANAIRDGLKQIYKPIKGDPQVLLINLPDNIKGAYVARNALDGMTKSPQFPRDIKNCLMVNPLEPVVPFGFLKDSLRKERDKVSVFNWASQSKSFGKISIPKSSYPIEKQWIDKDLKTICPSLEEYRELLLLRGNKESSIVLPSTPCFDMELLSITITDFRFSSKAPQAILYYTNSLNKERSNQKSIVRQINPSTTESTITFPLCSRPDWVLGGNSEKLILKLSGVKTAYMVKAELSSKATTMPFVYFDNSGYLGTKGYLHLSQKEESKEIFINGTGVQNTKGTMLVSLKANKFFKELNADSPESDFLFRVMANRTSTIKLERKMFPSVGIYELRPWCINTNNQLFRIAGDHIVVSVDS